MPYTIFTLPEPAIRISNGISGKETRLEQPAPSYPSTFVQKLYSEESLELWEDYAGQATSGEIFTAFPGIRKHQEEYIRDAGAKKLSEITKPYRDIERESWFRQYGEAIAWEADNSTLTPYCDGIVIVGETREELLGKVLANTRLFEEKSLPILNLQRTLIAAIWAELDFSTFTRIGWPE